MHRYAIIIDLRNCIGCRTCEFVCGELNNAPGDTSWRRVARAGGGKGHSFLPMSCMQCENPACLPVCPTGATVKRANGIVDIDETRCVGCGACVVACPYRARTVAVRDKVAPATPGNNGSPADRIGICTKCDFCRSHVANGVKYGLAPGEAPEATPHCVHHCLGGAMYFGDLEDPGSRVSLLIRKNNVQRIHDALGTEPSVYYILEEEQE